MRDMQTLSDYTKHVQARLNRSMAWSALEKAFSSAKPRRFVAGIAVASRARNSNGQAFNAAGAVALELPLPFLWDHDWRRPVGKITGLRLHDEALLFTAEIANDRLSAAEDVWTSLTQRLEHGISIGPFRLFDEDGADGRYERWGLAEVSVVTAGADRDARITRVWTRSNVVYLDRPSELEIWRS